MWTLSIQVWGIVQTQLLLFVLSWLLLASARTSGLLRRAVIRIHFFLLCGLVHRLSSSVQWNQVNERVCNEAIRCSLVLWSHNSILNTQTLAPSAGCGLRWWRVEGVKGQHGSINSRPCLSYILEDELLSHVLHTRSVAPCRSRPHPFLDKVLSKSRLLYCQ